MVWLKSEYPAVGLYTISERQEVLDMQPLSIFISSTCFDLKEQRHNIYSELSDMGYSVILSENGDVGYEQGTSLERSCLNSVSSTDIVVGIIGRRFGSKSESFEAHSITMNEITTAVGVGKIIFVFVERNVLAEFETYKKNQDLAENLKWAHVDDGKIFKFLQELNARKSIAILGFDHSADIIDLLKKQLSFLFANYIDKERKASQQELASNIKSETDRLEAVMGSLENLSAEIAQNAIACRVVSVPVLRRLLDVLGISDFSITAPTRKGVFSFLEQIGFSILDETTEAIQFSRNWNDVNEILTLHHDFFKNEYVNTRLNWNDCADLVKLEKFTALKHYGDDDVPF